MPTATAVGLGRGAEGARMWSPQDARDGQHPRQEVRGTRVPETAQLWEPGGPHPSLLQGPQVRRVRQRVHQAVRVSRVLRRRALRVRRPGGGLLPRAPHRGDARGAAQGLSGARVRQAAQLRVRGGPKEALLRAAPPRGNVQPAAKVSGGRLFDGAAVQLCWDATAKVLPGEARRNTEDPVHVLLRTVQ